MMKENKLIITLICFLHFTTKVNAQDFKFPIIKDTLKVSLSDINLFKPVNRTSFERIPFYLGKNQDSLILGRFHRDVTIPINNHFINKEFEKDYKWIPDSSIAFYFNQKETVLLEEYDFKQEKYINYLANILVIQNKTEYNFLIGYGYQIPIIIEAMDSDKKWVKIEYYHTYDCGVGLKFILINSEEIACVEIPKYHGDFKTFLRFKLGNNYSQPFEGEINRSLFVANKIQK